MRSKYNYECNFFSDRSKKILINNILVEIFFYLNVLVKIEYKKINNVKHKGSI